MFLHISYGIHMYQNRGLQIRASTGVVYPRTCVSRPLHHLVHLSDELVDVDLPVTEVTTLDVVLEFPCPPATSGVGELEGPQEVRGLEAQVGHGFENDSKNTYLLEVGAGGDDFVNEILDAKDVEFAKGSLDDAVVGEGNALLVDLSISTLVDKLANRLQVGFTARRLDTWQ